LVNGGEGGILSPVASLRVLTDSHPSPPMRSLFVARRLSEACRPRCRSLRSLFIPRMRSARLRIPLRILVNGGEGGSIYFGGLLLILVTNGHNLVTKYERCFFASCYYFNLISLICQFKISGPESSSYILITVFLPIMIYHKLNSNLILDRAVHILSISILLCTIKCKVSFLNKLLDLVSLKLTLQ